MRSSATGALSARRTGLTGRANHEVSAGYRSHQYLAEGKGAEFEALAAHIAQVSVDEIAFCIVSFHEQVLGCHTYLSRARRAEDVVRGYTMLDRVLDAFSSAPVLPFDDKSAEVFAELAKQRLRVATLDLRIGSIALAGNLTLVSRNLADFARIPGLACENWIPASGERKP